MVWWYHAITSSQIHGDLSTHAEETIWIHLQNQHFGSRKASLSTASSEIIWSPFGIGDIRNSTRSDPKANCIASFTDNGEIIVPERHHGLCGRVFLQTWSTTTVLKMRMIMTTPTRPWFHGSDHFCPAHAASCSRNDSSSKWWRINNNHHSGTAAGKWHWNLVPWIIGGATCFSSVVDGEQSCTCAATNCFHLTRYHEKTSRRRCPHVQMLVGKINGGQRRRWERILPVPIRQRPWP